ncbi:hypothetical protein JCGZ_20035 [Jatropha curcas]|uniref:Thioredoxin domain-containing protein n=1 Tax=Jatropha curcas TaxID=180498 RepID=A0A067LID0_JATCU|nr:hypothetical protein JCGZ_20035 [Jatropha curcas]
MLPARTLAILFTSVLLLFIVFWFLTPFQFSSLNFDGLKRAFSWLQHQKSISVETQYSSQFFRRSEAAYSAKNYYGLNLGKSPLNSDKPINNENDASKAHPSLEKEGLVMSPTAGDMYYLGEGVISEVHHTKWPLIPEKEHNSNNLSEAAISFVHENRNTTSISPNQYSDKALNRFKAPPGAEGSIGIQYDIGEITPRTKLANNKMDAKQEIQSHEVLPSVELESTDDGTFLYAYEESTNQELNIIEVVNEQKEIALHIVLEAAEVLDEKASNQDSFKVSPYHDVEIHDEPSFLSINENQQFESVEDKRGDFHDEPVLNMPSTEMEDFQLSDSVKDKKEDFRRVALMNMSKMEHFHGETEVDRPLYEMDDIVLSKENFSDFVLENKYVVVKFYMPWSYQGNSLALEYAAAAYMLKGKVFFARDDSTMKKELTRNDRIFWDPTLYFFIGGVHMHTCYYCRTRDAVVDWVKEKMNGGVRSVTEVLQAHNILMSESMIILGFLDTLELWLFAPEDDLENLMSKFQEAAKAFNGKIDESGAESRIDKVALYLEAVGGEKKRKVSDIGSQASQFYCGSASHASAASAGPQPEHTVEEFTEFRARVDDQ